MNRRGLIGTILALGGGIAAKFAPAVAAPVVASVVAPVVPAVVPVAAATVSRLTVDQVVKAYAANPHHPEVAVAYKAIEWGTDGGLFWFQNSFDEEPLTTETVDITLPLDTPYYGQIGVPWFVHKDRALPGVTPKFGTVEELPLPKYGDFKETDADLTEKYATGEAERINAIRERRAQEGFTGRRRLGPSIANVSHLAETTSWERPTPVWSGDGSTLIGYEAPPERVNLGRYHAPEPFLSVATA